MANQLPSGYTQIDYIESTGAQRINTGYYCTTAPRFSIELDIEPLSNGEILSCTSFRNGEGYLAIGAAFFDNWIWFRKYNEEISMYNISAYLPRILLGCQFTSSGCSMSVNGNTILTESAPQQMYQNLPIYLFCRQDWNRAGYDESTWTKIFQDYIAIRLYSCRIYANSGSLASELIPCKNSSGKVGLYDTVKRKFLTDEAGGSFKAGPVSSPTSAVISLLSSPSGGGTLTGGGTYEIGESVTVTAAAGVGYQFVRWTENGKSVSTSASYTFTAEQSRSLTAVFETVRTYTVRVTADPSSGGTVSGSGNFAENTNVSVAASAYSGYRFSGWMENGARVSDTASYTFRLTGNRSLTASFDKETASETPSSPPTTVITGGKWTGMGRREMYVDARDLQSDADPEKPLSEDEYIELLISRGKLRLSENPLIRSFDAVIRTLDPTYQYKKDFFLGDTITITDDRLGITADAVVQAAKWEISDEGPRLTLTVGCSLPELRDMLTILKRKG